MNEQEYRLLFAAEQRAEEDGIGPLRHENMRRALRKAEHKFTRAVALERGWAMRRQGFDLSELQLIGTQAPPRHNRWCIDHYEYMASRYRSRPVAILTHGYAPWPEMVRYAAEIGLKVERLPFSWYYPDVTTAAIFSGYRFATGVSKKDIRGISLEDLIALGLAV